MEGFVFTGFLILVLVDFHTLLLIFTTIVEFLL